VRWEAYTRECVARYGCEEIESAGIVSAWTPYVLLPSEVAVEEAGWANCTGRAPFNPTLVALRVDSASSSDITSKALRNNMLEGRKGSQIWKTKPATNTDTKSTRTRGVFDPKITERVRFGAKWVEKVNIVISDGIPRN